MENQLLSSSDPHPATLFWHSFNIPSRSNYILTLRLTFFLAYAYWHSISHLFGHSFRHMFWHSHSILTFFLPFFLACYLRYVLTFYLPDFLTILYHSNWHILAFCLAFSPACVLAQVCPAAQDRVRVQACSTASGACEMARNKWNPESRRAAKGAHQEERKRNRSRRKRRRKKKKKQKTKRKTKTRRRRSCTFFKI